MFLHPEVSSATVPLCPPLTPSAALPCLQLGPLGRGDKTAIIDGFASNSSIFKLQAICGAVNHKVADEAVKLDRKSVV